MNLDGAKTKFFSELEKALTIFGDKFLNNGRVRRSAVRSALDANDSSVIRAILGNEYLASSFITNVEGIPVFERDMFTAALSAREYAYDGFTKYVNEIGLSENGKMIASDDDVILDFPYKDTFLKAGMTKEDVKKVNEPYLNRIIAKDEVDALLEPKAFKNVEHFGDESIEKKNLVIKGNNLIGLSSIKEKFKGKVKLVYIDVPYYFLRTKENDSFSYNPNFKLSSWLTFMKNRLEIAATFLKPDGSIWIHVGEDGMHYLKVIADEIFGANHFVGTVPRKTRDGKSDVPFNFSQDFDWMLIYTVGNDQDSIVGRHVERSYQETDDFPGRPWRKADMTTQKTIFERPNSDFTMINPKTGKEYPVNPKRSWAVTKETFSDYYQQGGIGFPDDYPNMTGNQPFRRIFKDEDDASEKKAYASSDMLLKDFVKNIMGKAKTVADDEWVDKTKFSYAKPEKLMKSIIEVATDPDDYVLDFFAGSGSTLAAAHKMGRHYIGLEQIDEQANLIRSRLQDVIAGESGGISTDVSWIDGGEFTYAELATQNAFIIDEVIKADSLENLWDTLRQLNNSDYEFEVEVNKIVESAYDEGITLSDVKDAVLLALDSTMLYVSAANVDDENVQLSADDKAFTKSFYGDQIYGKD